MRSQSFLVESHMARTQVCGQQKRGGAKLHLLKVMHSCGTVRAVMGEIPSHPNPAWAEACLQREGVCHLDGPWLSEHTFSTSEFPHLKLEEGGVLIRVILTGATFSLSSQQGCVLLLCVLTREALSKPWVDWLLGQLNPCLSGIVTDTKVQEFF